MTTLYSQTVICENIQQNVIVDTIQWNKASSLHHNYKHISAFLKEEGDK